MNRRQFFSVLTAAAAARLDSASGSGVAAPGTEEPRRPLHWRRGDKLPWVCWERVRFQAGAAVPARIPFFQSATFPAPFALWSVAAQFSAETLRSAALQFGDHTMEVWLQGLCLARGFVPGGFPALTGPLESQAVFCEPIWVNLGEPFEVVAERCDFGAPGEGAAGVVSGAAPLVLGAPLDLLCVLEGSLGPMPADSPA